MQSIITVENVGKEYRIGTRDAAYGTLRDSLVRAIRAPFKGSQTSRQKSEERIWALRDVSFEVKPGEVVGIIGRNGAGKSTLLKILSRIVDPTTGNVKLYGRVGSLLEVGTGFHPELSGRENIYLNGAILGMKRTEIGSKFDEIVAFAEIEKFIDTPVKHYSSGMYMRLAFAVAAHLEPEILLVDEVLAVGDVAFQKKCLGKVEDVAREGRTVLFVSHNMIALQSLCKRAFWFDEGIIKDYGEINQVISNYLHTTITSALEKSWEDADNAPGNEEVKLKAVRVISRHQDTTQKITVRTPLNLEFEYWNYVEDALLNLSVVLYTLEGVCVLNARSEPQRFAKGLIWQSCHIPGGFLNDETYTVRAVIIKDTCVGLFDKSNLLMFDVHDVEREGNWYGKWIGVVRPQLKWEANYVSGLSEK
jgi:lipopolysaccharide transport system ATP-binding protein